MAAQNTITRERVLELFDFDPESGKFYWKAPERRRASLVGQEAGKLTRGGFGKAYWILHADGRRYRRARLAFLVANGSWPDPCVDHVNGDGLDDRPANLRAATHAENMRNIGPKRRRIDLPPGVHPSRHGRRFYAKIVKDRKPIILGYFATSAEAAASYDAARRQLFGEFAHAG